MTNENKLLFKDDVGINLRVWAGSNLDLSTATSLKIAVRKPSGLTVDWTASLASDNNYYATYTTVSGDLDQLGEYYICLVANFSGGVVLTGKTDIFEVVNRCKDVI